MRRNRTGRGVRSIPSLEIPPDLGEVFDRHPGAGAYFEAFPRSVRRGVLTWIFSAKRAETRARSIEETARLAQENVRAHQWRR
jgi:uncharacterized protein YdeI (YjbR/CyaY-like superfamily)